MSATIGTEPPDRQLIKDGAAVNRAVAALRARILNGELSPGEQLRQEEMAGDLGLSRAPIREALQVLADQGLLQHRPHSGYFVAKRHPTELAQIYIMLEFLETEIMKTIVWPSDDVLAKLEQVNDELGAYVDGVETSPMNELNQEFHFTIFRLSPLKVVLEELERLWAIASPHIAMKLGSPEARARTVNEHRRILKELRARRRTQVIEELARHRSQRTELIHTLLPSPEPLRSRRPPTIQS